MIHHPAPRRTHHKENHMSDTDWAEDAAASLRALYDNDSGRLDNWSER